MTTQTIEYKGDYIKKYQDDRRRMYENGWKIRDEYYVEKIIQGPIGTIGPYITGYVIYEKDT